MPNVPVDFVLFALTLAGIALFHRQTLKIAVAGLTVIALYHILIVSSSPAVGLQWFGAHLAHHWVTLVNLGGLLTGFALLSNHFQRSHVPAALPRWLPSGWVGAFAMLVIVFVLSSFLDNIAAALIGGAMARVLFPKVHVGYLAGIVAASNAGGSGSVVGDTTTTMMWIAGIPPQDVIHAYVAAVGTLLVTGIPAALQQHARAPLHVSTEAAPPIDWVRVGIVAVILVSAISVNVTVNTQFPHWADDFPFLGVTVWVALLATAPLRAPEWSHLDEAAMGALFLLSLVLSASMMPVEQLPAPSWQTTLGLGFVSAVFDNIPLTALALAQGGYDWGFLAYAVGFGGSMIWFGSSAGVALSNMYPEARSAAHWLREGWHVVLAYVVGFFILLGVLGWHPQPDHREGRGPAGVPTSPQTPAAPAH